MHLSSVSGSRPAWDWHKDTVLVALVMAVAFAVFANSLPNGFVYDDVPIFESNPRLDRPWDLRAFFATPYWGVDQDHPAALYRPLTLWCFALERALFGAGPSGVHWVNVLANALLGGVVYLFLWALLGNRLFAFLCSLLYAVHPIHTEVVANGVGQSEILAGLCVVLGAFFHLRYVCQTLPRPEQPLSRAARRRGEIPAEVRGRRSDLAVAAVLYLVGLLCKESAVVLPGLVFLAEWLIVRRGDLRAALVHWRGYAVYVPGLVVFLALRAAVVGGSRPAIQEVMASASAIERQLYSLDVLFRSLGQAVCPLYLCAEYSDYAHLVVNSVTTGLVLAVLAGVAAVAGACVWLARRRQYLPLFGLGWFLVAILPFSNLLFPIGTVRAERLLFVPSLGVVVCLGWLLAEVFRRQRHVAVLLGLLLAGFYAWRTVTRNPDWRSSERLWQVTLRANPGSPLAWRSVGDTYRDRGELQQAAEFYRKAYELRDGAGFGDPEAHSRYANAMAKLGHRREAAVHYRKAIARDPRHYTALNNLGELLLQGGQFREALDLLQRAADTRPDDFMPWGNLAQAASLAGDHDRALAAIDKAVALVPGRKDVAEAREEILARRRAAGTAPAAAPTAAPAPPAN